MYSLGTVGTRKPVRYKEYQGVRIWESCKVLHIMETQSGPHILSDLTRCPLLRGSTVLDLVTSLHRRGLFISCSNVLIQPAD